jgi:seryl-tRNA synthetase
MTTENSQLEPTFLEQLFQHGLLIPSPTDGIYGRSGVMDDVINRLEDAITAVGRDSNTDVMRFPPVMSRVTTEQSGYLASFPQLLGSVHSFMGKHKEHQQLLQDVAAHHDWGHHLSATQVVMTPAACYPVYGTLANTTLPEHGRLVDVASYCFRHEPSKDPARMQAFRMREFVRIADPASVQAWRDQWTTRGLDFLSSLGLQPVQAPANDPFFGPGGRFLAASQQEQSLKFELLAAVSTDKPTTAVMSLNYHQEHFGEEFNIRTADGNLAHTACTGFGLERIALGLFRAHGFDPAEWPAPVRARLWA